MKKRAETKISRRNFLKGAVAGAALLGGPGIPYIARKAVAAEPFLIGVVSPASGNYADHGMMERLGMQMAVEEIKNVLDRPVKLLVEDDETDPQVAARKARRLIEVDKVKFLLGGVSSSTAVSVGEVAQRAGALFFACNQNSDTITGEKAHRNVFRVCPDMAMALKCLGPYVIEHVGKKWYFLTHDYEWGWSGTRWGRKVLEQYKGTDLGESKIPMGTRDYSAFIQKALAAKPEALVITVGGVDRAALIEQCFEFGVYKKTTIVHTLYDYEDVWAAGPKKNFGIHGTEWYYGIDTPTVKSFVAWYKKKYPATFIPVPTENTVNGYIGLREMLKAIQRVGKDDVGGVIKALEGYTVPFNESLKNDPILIRDWDHQFVWAFYIVRSKKEKEMKDRTDFFDIVKWCPGKDVARTKEENPVKLEDYPA